MNIPYHPARSAAPLASARAGSFLCRRDLFPASDAEPPGRVAGQRGRGAADVGVFVDLRRPDTENRLFVLDLRTGRALVAAPCLNGRTDRRGRVRYSNVVSSCCSSRGLAWTSFEQGYRGHFGRAYRLHGLGAGTSNLAARAVVLHSWRYVPPAPVASTEHPIQSWGCPALAPARLAEVAALLRAQAGRRVLVCLR